MMVAQTTVFDPEVVFGLGGLLLSLIIIPIVGLIAGRYSSRQWREVAEAREERIGDLEQNVTRLEAKLEEKDQTIATLVDAKSDLENVVDRVGGAKVYELLATQAAAQADRHEEWMRLFGLIEQRIAAHETRAETRFAETVKALTALTKRIENGTSHEGRQ